MRVGSLFAGVGGFDVAAEAAGMDVVWQSENDKAASRVLEHHWPGRNLGDTYDIYIADRYATGIVDTDIAAPAVDVLCGGFPCQDYSVAGNREGLDGDRGALWWQYHRLISEGRPTWVIGENVPGLLSSRDGQDFATIIDSLTELGYGVVWAVLDAQWFGVAQRRRRVFIVGHSGGRPRPEILALSEGMFGHPEPRREVGQQNAATIETRPTPDRRRAESGHLIAFAQNQRDEVRDLNDLAGTVAAKPGMKQQTYVVNSRQDSVSIEDTSLPIDTGTPPHTVSTGTTVRRLTPLECERLQGFPDGWTDIPGNSDSQRYRQMGNAVAVPVAEWIMRRIAKEER